MRKALFIGFALVVLSLVYVYLNTLEDTPDVSKNNAVQALRPVEFVTADIGDHSGRISIFATVKPHRQIDLRPRVAGIVKKVDSAAVEGGRVYKDNGLLELEDAPYQAVLANARADLKRAEVTLLQKQQKRDITLKDWRAVKPGIVPPDMAIHLPDVRVAEQAVEAAQAQIAAAEYDVTSTLIHAPFDAIITKRLISPGQSVNEGDVLFSLLDDKQLDLRVSLSTAEWGLLDKNWHAAEALLFSEAGTQVDTAHVKRGGGFLDNQSRRHQLFLTVDKTPESTVLPGQFLQVQLAGISIENTIRIPGSALTRDGFVWYLDEEDKLQRFESSAIFRNDKSVVVKIPDVLSQENGAVRVVVLPMSAYLPGQQVSPEKQEVNQ